MQLGNDHPLGAVNNKSTVFGHEWNFTHVDFLLFDVLDVLDRLAAFAVKNNQVYLNAQRSSIGNAAHDALFDIKGGLTQTIAHVFQRSIARITDNREHRFESGMQAYIAQLFLIYPCLQKFSVRIQLDGQQVRNIHNVLQLAKVFADTFFLSI